MQGDFYNTTGCASSGSDVIIQNDTISTNSNNMYRYYSGRSISAGKTIVSSSIKTQAPVLFKNGTHVIMDATNSVLLKDDVTIEVGCELEIK